jgi:hypothetical protein
MITSTYLKERFGDLYDPAPLCLDADKNGIYSKESGKRVASRLAWARYVFRSLENGRADAGRIYKISYFACDNESACEELETIFKLQNAAVAGVPKIVRLGILESGGLWAELEGIRNARSLAREIFGRVPRFFQVMIKAATILKAIHAQGVIHGDVKPANILINDQQEIEWIDFEPGAFTHDFSALDENQEPIMENRGPDTDAFSFILTLAIKMDELLSGSTASDAAQPLFRKMRDEYLGLIFAGAGDGVKIPPLVDPFKLVPDGVVQRPRGEWPRDMEIVLGKLRSDEELYRSAAMPRQPTLLGHS